MSNQKLNFIPPQMAPWGMQLVLPAPSQFGEVALIGVEQASIETHHQVMVVDESGLPARGVWVLFGFGSGRPVNIPIRANYWQNAPVVLTGNAQRTDGAGYAQHTFGEGGEDIFVLFTDTNDDLTLPSAVVKNCTWQRTPVARFEHTGVSLVFQLQRNGVVSLDEWKAEMERRVSALEAKSV